MRLYIAILLAVLLALAGVVLGFWWAPFPIGLAIGALDRRMRVTISAGAGVGLLAWAVPLVVAHARYGLGPTAQSIAAIIGFDHQAALPLALTVLLGTLLGATGAWLGSSARAVVTSVRTGT